MEEKHWSNRCANILGYCQNNSEVYCNCYADYCLWSKDNPKLDFEQWKILVNIEYQSKNQGDLND